MSDIEEKEDIDESDDDDDISDDDNHVVVGEGEGGYEGDEGDEGGGDEGEGDEGDEGGGDEGSDNDNMIGPVEDYDAVDGANSDNNDEDSDEEDESYLQKFNAEVNKNYIVDFHPECMIHNYDEISAMTNVIRDDNNNVIDDLHRSIPYLTKYEKARVLGQRAKQINSGAKAFVKIPDNVIDGYLVAEIELIHKRIPFIIRRPISGGGCEYWNLKDLEIIGF